MPAPPSTKQKAANQTAMSKAKASSGNFGGINTSTVRTSDRGSTNNYGPNAAQQRQQQQSQYRSPPATAARGLLSGGGQSTGVLGTPSPLMQKAMNRSRANLLGQQYSQYRSPPGTQGPATIAPGSPDAQYLQNQYRAYNNPDTFVNQSDMAEVPIPRQNPLSDTSKFNYSAGRDRDYVFGGMDQEAISRAVAAQENFGAPVTATSGMRNPLLNRKVGGAKGSQHMQGRAIDLSIPDQTGEDTARLLSSMKQAGFTGIGGYRPGKVHGDIGPERMWGPDTHAASISQLPQNMQIAMAGGEPPPKPTLLRAITPTVQKGLGALKNIFAENDIPIPRQKPMIPSDVAPAMGAPIPQMKPRVPSIVAPSNGPPIPLPKPQTANIQPAGGPPTTQAETGPSFWQQYAPDALQAAATAVDQNLIQPTKEQIAKYGGFERAGKLAQAAVGIMSFLPGGKVDNSRYTDRTTEGVKNSQNQNTVAAPTPVPIVSPVAPQTRPALPPQFYPQYSQMWAGLPTGRV